MSQVKAFSVDMVWNATLAAVTRWSDTYEDYEKKARWRNSGAIGFLALPKECNFDLLLAVCSAFVLPYIFPLKILLLVMQLPLQEAQVGEWWTKPKWRCGYPAK